MCASVWKGPEVVVKFPRTVQGPVYGSYPCLGCHSGAMHCNAMDSDGGAVAPLPQPPGGPPMAWHALIFSMSQCLARTRIYLSIWIRILHSFAERDKSAKKRDTSEIRPYLLNICFLAAIEPNRFGNVIFCRLGQTSVLSATISPEIRICFICVLG